LFTIIKAAYLTSTLHSYHDGGPVVLQAKVPIFPQDSIAEIEQRVQQQEYAIYPLVINWFLSQRLVMDEAGKALLDGHSLPLNGYASDD